MGIKCVIAESFARIFYRNAINVGLLIIEAPEIRKAVEEGDEISVDVENSEIKTDDETIAFKKLPSFMMDIIDNGGLIEYLKK